MPALQRKDSLRYNFTIKGVQIDNILKLKIFQAIQVNILHMRFVTGSNRARKDGTATLVHRITYFEKRKQFSTGLNIKLKDWNSKRQSLNPSADNAVFKMNDLR